MNTKETYLFSDTALVSSSPSMDEKEKTRSIRLPESLWEAIDEDAKRCKRSALKQMEAVLSLYYNLGEPPELDAARIKAVSEVEDDPKIRRTYTLVPTPDEPPQHE